MKSDPPDRSATTKTRWQFSLRAVMILTALVAIIVAFAANYPGLALAILCGTVWVLFESGAIGQIVCALSEPKVYVRHPILATVTWFLTGTFCLAATGVFLWAAFSPKSSAPFWAPLIPALLFGGFGSYCIYLLWNSLRNPPNPVDEKSLSDL
jgi:hypothetical protein